MNISDLPELQLFTELAEHHGHYCPMSTLGLRLGWAARKRLQSPLQNATYFAQTCARDGIRLALDARDLKSEESGQHQLRFSDREHHWQIEMLPQTLTLAATYRTLASEVERDALLEHLRTDNELNLFSFELLGDGL